MAALTLPVFGRCQDEAPCRFKLLIVRLRHVNLILLLLFGENRTNGSGVIQVSVNFNMAAGGHLGL